MNYISNQRSLYPLRYALPGDKRYSERNLAQLSGPRAVIAHALTFHGLPAAIDDRIDRLPLDSELQELGPYQKCYISFLAYSLKQMVAAGTVRPEAAWDLFFRQWPEIKESGQTTMSDTDIICMREDLLCGILENKRQDVTAILIQEGNISSNGLAKIEFIARAGKAGLSRFDSFSKWIQDFYFQGSGASMLPVSVRHEYRKALWLEMRILEAQLGCRIPKYDVAGFELSDDGYFHPKGDDGENSRIQGSVDVFKKTTGSQNGRPVDSVIKAEIGHWMFEHYTCRGGWVCELMDRMNMTGFTERVNEAFNTAPSLWTPEQQVWMTGGFYLTSGEGGFPEYPGEFLMQKYGRRLPVGDHESRVLAKYAESHVMAEYAERLIRKKIIDAVTNGAVRPEDAFSIYRKAGLYFAVFPPHHNKGLLRALDHFKIDDINAAYRHITCGKTGQ